MLQSISSGVLTGTFYALIGSGFALVFGTGRVFNLAHGELLILGAYVGERLWVWAGVPPLLAMPVAALVPLALMACGPALLRRVGEPYELRALVASFGASLILQSLLLATFTGNYRLIVLDLWDRGIRVAGLEVTWGRLIVAAVSLGCLGLLHLTLTRTLFGKALRAASLDREAAWFLGVDVGRLDRQALALGGALAGLAGPFFASLRYVTPAGGLEVTLIALVLTIFVGVGRVGGLLLGGVLLGVAEAVAVFLAGAAWRELVSVTLLLVLLRARPRGLFAGRRS